VLNDITRIPDEFRVVGQYRLVRTCKKPEKPHRLLRLPHLPVGNPRIASQPVQKDQQAVRRLRNLIRAS